MSENTKQTSPRVAHLAAKTLSNGNSSDIAKSLSASLIAQSNTGKQTGVTMEKVASKVLLSDKYSDSTKTLAASVLSQANKTR